MTGRIEVALPFWLDRPDEEALDVALAAREAGFDTLWIGEMATYDAFALATAVGHRAPGLRLKLGPLALGVRSPVALALGASSVASFTGSRVDIALGASSPAIVAGWHDRQWGQHASRMRETIECLRSILAGTRADYTGRHVRTHGFRLRKPMPDSRIAVGAFGPAMTRVAAKHADEVVLNLVPPARVAEIRAIIDAEAAAAGRMPPRLTGWVPVAVNPGDTALGQLAAQVAVYLAPPGYAEMFSELGFLDLVQRARAGAKRADLATAVPFGLLDQVGGLGAPDRIAARLQAYHQAGADTVAIVPSTAEDPGGRAALAAAAAPAPKFEATSVERYSATTTTRAGDRIVTITNAQCRLAARPVGLPKPTDWTFTEEPVPSPADGELLVRVEYLSVDPAMRTWMNAGRSYVPPVEIGEVMRAAGIGRVMESRHADFAVGDEVYGVFGVQRYALSDGRGVTPVDTTLAPAPVHLGALGIGGLTAYFGLLDVGRPEPGQTVVISGAAGSVGSVAGQIARIKGCRTIGIAGGKDKCRWLVEELGFDAAIDYKAGDLHAQLKAHAPNGVDVFFDNVGGEALEAALADLARGARVVLSGAVSQYNTAEGGGPANYMQLLVARASMTGFVIFDYADRYAEGVAQLAKWLRNGELRSREHVVAGDVSDFPDVLLKLFRGENTGKLVLALSS